MATSSFFYGGSTAPEQNTVDELIDALNAATAAADEDRVDAEQAAQQASDSAANALVSEQNTASLNQQTQSLYSQTQASAAAAAASATSSSNSANASALSASQAATSAASASTSAAESAVSASSAAASASNPYVITVGSDLAGTGWNYDFGLITDAPDPLGTGTDPGYIETVAINIADVQEVADNIASVIAAPGSATAAAASATSAANSASSASTSASSASTSATSAASSATAASTSATAAASSATSASTSATNAAASASAASVSESNAISAATSAGGSADAATGAATSAGASASAAAASAASAAASFDSFDDRYLGSKTSAPTTDNDGNALLTGALYYNSTSGQMNVWSGSSWGVVGNSPDVVVGPASSTDNAIARFDGTTGKLVQNSTTTISDEGNISVAPTWNSSGTIFTGLKVNPTNTASADGSLLVDLQVGGSSKFSVDKVGVIRGLSGYSNGLTTTGLGVIADYVTNGIGPYTFFVRSSSGARFVGMGSDVGFGWGGSGDFYPNEAPDVCLRRDDANILAQRSGTNPQAFRLYNTYTDGSNYARANLAWVSGDFKIQTTQAGTGSSSGIILAPSNGSVVSTGTLYSEGFQVGNTKQVLFSNGSNYNQGLAAIPGTDGVVKVTNGSTGLGILKASSLDIDTLDLGVLP
jgi:hypothetical protein